MGKRGPKPIDPKVRFWRHVEKHESGCWLWTGGKTGGGYGTFMRTRGKSTVAHRFAYEEFVGSIPDGLDLDHLCRVRHCVNPSHLEPVTRSENLRRGILHGPADGGGAAAHQRAKTHCPRGHEYTPENTYIQAGPVGPKRSCQTCRRAQTAKFNAAAAAARRERRIIGVA